MKIALLGVTGNVGTHLLDELLRRGHAVTGIARHPDKVLPRVDLILERTHDRAEIRPRGPWFSSP